MKHSEWLRLQAEGENICAILRQQGYRCTKQTRRLSWQVTNPLSSPSLASRETGRCYVLTWLPSPVGDWSVVPNDNTPEREQLMLIVQTALKQSGKEEYPSTETLNRPWAIARILPDARHYIVARFFNRQDANDHLRFLQRFIPAAEFEIVFDIPEENK